MFSAKGTLAQSISAFDKPESYCSFYLCFFIFLEFIFYMLFMVIFFFAKNMIYSKKLKLIISYFESESKSESESIDALLNKYGSDFKS